MLEEGAVHRSRGYAGIIILCEDKGDLDEPEYAKYLEEEILDMSTCRF